MKRREFIRTGSAWVAAIALAGRHSSAATASAAEPFDITFYHIGDPHYLALDTSTKGGVTLNPVIRGNLRLIMQLREDTEMPGGLGTVGKTRGAVDVGDCIEAGNETDPETGEPLGGLKTREMQWENYVADLGLTGREEGTLIDFPVYEGYGNHDQDSFVQGIIDRISARNKNRPGITAVSAKFEYPEGEPYAGVAAEGLHYAWQWGPVHFIQTNIRVGDSYLRYPAAGSHTFLRNYLEGVVGKSGAPVVIATHLPPNNTSEGDWPATGRQRFYELIRDYNVIGILCGHTHSFDAGEWRGPAGDGPVAVPVYRCDTIHRSTSDGGFMSVFRIKSDPSDPRKAKLVIARRMRNNTWADTVTRDISVSSLSYATEIDEKNR